MRWFLLLLAGCVTQPAPVVPDVVCMSAYDRLKSLGCEMAHSGKGASFAVVCQHYARQQIDIGAVCVARAASCSEAASCK